VTATLTDTERLVYEHVMAINMGMCAICGAKPATNFGHRLPAGQGGPVIVPNGIPVCGHGNIRAWGCHGRTEHARTLSYRCGWLIPQDVNPAGRNARIAATPALIRTQLAPAGAWHILDHLGDDSRPVGMPRLAEPDEVGALMFAGTLADAIVQLNARGNAA
jgi:hypothetical protein